jgi:glycosyltransferase involved in cell wall biosynthesis
MLKITDVSETKPKVTIGICAKNAERTIRLAVESAMWQDFNHDLIEIIFVDDGSTDNTLCIVEELFSRMDFRSKVFSGPWRGIARARNTVVEHADSEYVIWLDSDEILSRAFVKEQVNFMDCHQSVGVAKGKYSFLKNKSQETLVSILENTEFMLSTISEKNADSMTLGTGGCIYRLSAIREIGGFDPQIKGAGEDVDAEERIRKCGWHLFVTSALFYEKRRDNWKSLWSEYFWLGIGGQQLLRKGSQILNLYKFLPPVAVAAEFLKIPIAYKITHEKAVLLLPLHYIFKRSAWFFGFLMERTR